MSLSAVLPFARTTRPVAVPLAQTTHPSVVHITEAPLGGVVTYLDELLSRQIASGAHIGLVTPAINLKDLADVVSGCAVVTSFDQRRRSVGSLLRLGWLSVKHVRRHRPDIVHVHSTLAGIVIRLSRPLLPRGTRLIYCPHGWATSRRGRLSPLLARAMEYVLSPLADRIVCISEFERIEGLRIGIAKKRLSVVENGVGPVDMPMDSRPGAARHNMVIGFAGRFDRQKGFDILLEVMRQLGPGFEALAIGSAITERSESTPNLSNLQCLGWQPRDKVLALLRDVDLLLMPSRWEGFGLVAAEAMQAGTAVFASRVGALPDIVVDRVTGRLFEPDNVDEIVGMIRSTTRGTLDTFGKAGRQRYLERYTADRMVRDMALLYDSVCDHPAEGRRAS